MQDQSPVEWVRIGVLTKPHGIKGEVAVHLDNPESEILVEGLTLQITPKGKPARTFTVARVFAGGSKIALDGVSDRDVALALRGAEVAVRREDFPPLDDDEAYLVDLVGAVVVATDDTVLGTITGFSDNGAQPLAVIATPDGRAVEMPFVPGLVVDIDEDARRVVAQPPGGMFSGEVVTVEPEP